MLPCSRAGQHRLRHGFQVKTGEGVFVEIVLWAGKVRAVELVPYVIDDRFTPSGPRDLAASILDNVLVPQPDSQVRDLVWRPAARHPGGVTILALLAPRAPVEPDLIVVGGVPGAGKSTAIAQTVGLPGVRVLDPDQLRGWLRGRLPARIPYRAYRPVVHILHTLRVLGGLLAGPTTGRRLVVHDPATRPHRRTILVRLARLRGWTPALVYVDIDRAGARRGQVERGRVVRASSFDGHWRRWQRLRTQLMTDLPTAVGGGFDLVDLVDREQVAAVLIQRLGGVSGQLSPSQDRPTAPRLQG